MRSLTPKQVLNRLYASGTLCILFDYLLCFVAALRKRRVTHVHNHAFIKEHFLGIGKDSVILGWTVWYL